MHWFHLMPHHLFKKVMPHREGSRLDKCVMCHNIMCLIKNTTSKRALGPLFVVFGPNDSRNEKVLKWMIEGKKRMGVTTIHTTKKSTTKHKQSIMHTQLTFKHSLQKIAKYCSTHSHSTTLKVITVGFLNK